MSESTPREIGTWHDIDADFDRVAASLRAVARHGSEAYRTETEGAIVILELMARQLEEHFELQASPDGTSVRT